MNVVNHRLMMMMMMMITHPVSVFRIVLPSTLSFTVRSDSTLEDTDFHCVDKGFCLLIRRKQNDGVRVEVSGFLLSS